MAEITIKDIAKECGVGVSTVSRALNNHPDINPDTRNKILKVIEERGFVPNNSARNLKRIETNTIAVLIKGISNPFFSDMIKIIEAKTEERGYDIVLHHVEAKENEVEVALKLVKEKRLQGIIFLGGEFVHSDEKLAMISVPYVFSTAGLNQKQLNNGKYACISVDDYVESTKIVNYLIEMGHTKIAILSARKEDMSVGRLRLEGYISALENNNIEVDNDLIVSLDVNDGDEEYTMENGYMQVKKLLDRKTGFGAIYAISDTLAIGALRALKEAGLRVPEDVSVIGFDGITLGDYTNPRLTSLRQPVEDMALATASLICDIIEGKRNIERLLFPGELMVRESTGPNKSHA